MPETFSLEEAQTPASGSATTFSLDEARGGKPKASLLHENPFYGTQTPFARFGKSYIDTVRQRGIAGLHEVGEGAKAFGADTGDASGLTRVGQQALGAMQAIGGGFSASAAPISALAQMWGRQVDKMVPNQFGFETFGGNASDLLLGFKSLPEAPKPAPKPPKPDYIFADPAGQIGPRSPIPEPPVEKAPKRAQKSPVEPIPEPPATPAPAEPPPAPAAVSEPPASPAKPKKRSRMPSTLGEGEFTLEEAQGVPDTLEASKHYGGPGAPKFQEIEAPDPLNLEPLEKGTFELARDLNRALGLTHRQGRIAGRPGVTGIYKTKEDVVRTKAMHEIDTLSHEGGHALEFHDPKRYPELQSQMKAFGNHLETLAYPGANPRVLRQEGFAEFFRWYITNPEEARRRAPQFYDAFEDALEKDNPELLGKLQDVQGHHTSLMNAPSAVAAMTEVTTEAPKGPILREVDQAEEKGPKRWAEDWAHYIYYGLVNRHHGIQVAVDRMIDNYERRTGKRLEFPTRVHPERILQMAAGARDAAMEDITKGIPDYQTKKPTTRGLTEAVDFAMGKPGQNEPAVWTHDRYHEFSTYLNARNMLQQWARYQRGEREMPPGRMPPTVYKQAIRTFEAANPHWPQAARMVYDWANAIWKLRKDAGFITQAQYDEGLINHPDYVPLMREMENPGEDTFVKPIRGGGAGGVGTGKEAGGVRRQTGSTRNVIDPLFALGQQAMELRMLIARNEAYWALRNIAAKTRQSGGIVENIPAKQTKAQHVGLMEVLESAMAKREGNLSLRDEIELEQAVESITDILGEDAKGTIYRAGEINERGEPIIYGWKRGKRYASQLAGGKLGHMMYSAFTDLNRPMRDSVVAAASMPARILRWNVVTHPSFFTRNVVRDQPAAAAFTNVGYVPFVDWVRGIKSVFDAHDTSFTDYKRAGGTLGGMQTAAENQIMARRSLKSLRDQGINIREINSLSDIKDAMLKDVPEHMRRGFEEFAGELKTKRGRRRALRELPSRFTEGAEVLASASEMSETGTRMGIYKKAYDRAIASGMDEWSAAREAAYQATDVLNFNRRGAFRAMQAFQRVLPFLGANIQGLDKAARAAFDSTLLRRMAGEKPRTPGEVEAFKAAQNAWVWALGMAAATVAYRMYYADDPVFANVNQKTRTTHWVFVDDDTGEYFALPKPYELGFPSNIAERAVEWAHGDKQAPGHLMKDALTMLVPQVEAPPVIPMGLLTNKDYFGSPVVPKGTEGLEPQDQKDIYTSWLAEAAPLIGGSPAKTDYVMQQLIGGNWMPDINRGLDKVMRPERPEMASNLPDMFFVRSWVKQVTRGSGAGQDVWNVLERMEPKADSFAKLVAAGPSHEKSIDEAYKRLEKMDPATRTWAMVNTFGDAGMKQAHPLSHATKEFSAIAKMSKDIQVGDLKTPDGESIELNPHQRREAFEALRYLNMVQSHNALVAMKEPGYGQLKPMSMASANQRLANVDPRLLKSLRAYEVGSDVLPISDLEAAWRATQARYSTMPTREEFQNMIHPKRGRSGFMQSLRPEMQ